MHLYRLVGVMVLTGLAVACASRGPIHPEPFPRPHDAGESRIETRGQMPDAEGVEGQVPTAGSVTAMGAAVVTIALQLQGAPYAPGGSGPDGFDCSGFVQYVFASEGIPLPRTVSAQFAATTEIAAASIAPGDLIFFRTLRNGPSHVGIAIGDGTFVHAPSSRGVVRVESLASSYWRDHFDSVRRVR